MNARFFEKVLCLSLIIGLLLVNVGCTSEVSNNFSDSTSKKIQKAPGEKKKSRKKKPRRKRRDRNNPKGRNISSDASDIEHSAYGHPSSDKSPRKLIANGTKTNKNPAAYTKDSDYFQLASMTGYDLIDKLRKYNFDEEHVSADYKISTDGLNKLALANTIWNDSVSRKFYDPIEANDHDRQVLYRNLMAKKKHVNYVKAVASLDFDGLSFSKQQERLLLKRWQKIAIGLGVAVVVLAGAYYLVPLGEEIAEAAIVAEEASVDYEEALAAGRNVASTARNQWFQPGTATEMRHPALTNMDPDIGVNNFMWLQNMTARCQAIEDTVQGIYVDALVVPFGETAAETENVIMLPSEAILAE